MLPESTRQDVAGALDEVANDLLQRAGIQGPPVDALELARRLALIVATNDAQAERGRLVRLQRHVAADDGGTIVIKTDPRPERMQWAVTHEIGEHFAHRAFERLAVSPTEAPSNSRELIANALAGRILLPSTTFFDDAIAADWDLLELKRRYATASHELIARRMLDGEPPIIVTIFDNRRLTTRQTNTGRRAPFISEFERACLRAAHQNGAPAVANTDSLKVQAWPIHEPDWKREISRCEILELVDDF